MRAFGEHGPPLYRVQPCAICCFYDLEGRAHNNSVAGTSSQPRAPPKRNPLEFSISKVRGESPNTARIHHRYTRPLLIPVRCRTPLRLSTTFYPTISPVSRVFAPARTEIRARTKEGLLERIHGSSRVKYRSGSLRATYCGEFEPRRT